MAIIASLRDLSLRVQRAESERSEFRKKEETEAIDAFLAQPTAGAEQFKIVAEVIKSRIDRNSGNTSTTDALIARCAALGGMERPILLFANPIKMNEAQAACAAAGGSDLNRRGMQVVDKRWVDIGFWISADGKVDEPEVIRQSGNTDWTDVVLKPIKSLQYAPLKAEADGSSPGIYAVERYTLTAQFEDGVTGTRIRQRSPIAKIERIALTG